MAPSCTASSPALASTLPPGAYGSEELFEIESEKIFRSAWMPLCREEQVGEINSYYSIDLLGMALVVTRDRYGEVRVLSRTCRHRWMEIACGSGVAPALQCPYHLWTYAMDGHLVGAPEMQGVEDFCKEEIALQSYRHEIWQGFIFVNLDGQAEPLAPQLSGLDEYLELYDFGGYQTITPTDWGECAWDWKVMVDNFMECYHHMGPHRKSLESEYPAKLSYTDAGGEAFSLMWACQAGGYEATPPFLSPGAAGLPDELRHKLAIFIVYPLLQVVVGPGFMYWLKTLPLGPGRIQLQLDIAMSPAALAAPDLEARQKELIEAIVEIHKEDLDVCAAVQRAISGGAQGQGRLSLLEQPLWEFYQYLGRRLGLATDGLSADSKHVGQDLAMDERAISA